MDIFTPDMQRKLSPVCLDLSNYRNSQINLLSLLILNREYSQLQEFVELGKKARIIIVNESSEIYQRIFNEIAPLRRQISVKMEKKNIDEVKRILDYFTTLCGLPDDQNEPHIENQKILFNANVFDDIFTIIRKPGGNTTSEKEGMSSLKKASFVFLKKFMKKENVRVLLFVNFIFIFIFIS